MTAAAKLRYPRKAEIDRAMAAAKSCGLDVAGFEVTPTGTIRIFEARAMPDQPANDFERFMDKL